MSYIINGPTQIGDTGQLNEILGDLQLSDVCTATGDLIYSSNAAGLMVALPIGTAGQILTVAGGVPTWAGASNVEEGFSARKTGTQAVTGTPADIAGWSTATAPEFDTTGGDWVNASGLYTASLAGTVNARAVVSLSNTRNNGERTLSLYWDDGATPANYVTVTVQPSANNAIPTVLNLATSLTLAIGDALSLQISSTGAGTCNVLASPQTVFSITKNFTP